MKETYYLNGKTLPAIPVPHDCVIKEIRHGDEGIEFIFEDDITRHDSAGHFAPGARSLIVRYHFADSPGDFSVYKWVKSKKPFSKDGCFRPLDNGKLTALTEGKFSLEYLYHNVGYCSVITKLFADGPVILDVWADRVELEWIY